MYRVGVDIGGTFTDVVVASQDGQVVRAKALTTPDDYTEGVIGGIDRAARALDLTAAELMRGCAGFVNGTTVVTNAIAQQRGRRVGLLTTRGFKQSIYIHRGIREIQLDLQKETRPPDIVLQRHVGEVDERVSRQGDVLVPLSADDVRREAKRLVDEEHVEALAICFLWSFRHPEHEQEAARIVRELYPGLFVTVSSEIYPRIREYERMNTAVLNAFVSEGAETYIGKLVDRVGELGLDGGHVSFMHALGGHISADEAMANPIRLCHSGPVGGIVAATQLASVLGESDLITADLGGTSFDTALIRGRQPAYAHRTTVNRLLTGLSSVDVYAVGAGGGSVCWVDERGLPQIGPRSAGAFPGPACYGHGGAEPTLTDVSLILGLIDPERFWGGALVLDADAAVAALQPIADRLGRPLLDVASGFHEIAITQMASAIEKISLGRGLDPRDFTVIGYGGGSGLFLAEVCRELGIRRLVMPRAAATFSAYGLLFADALQDASTTAQWILGSGSVDAINATFAALERRAVAALHREGFDDEDVTVRREADVKFAGQSFEISLAWPAGPVAEGDRDALTRHFVEEYERVYGPGSAWEGFPVELHTARVVAAGRTQKPPVISAADVVAHEAEATGERRIVLAGENRVARTFDGPALTPGSVVEGPALVDDVDTTLLVPAGTRLEIDALGNYVFAVGELASSAGADGAQSLITGRR